jgi:outer membrane protein
MRNLALVALGAVALTAPSVAPAQRVPGAVVAVVDTGRIYSECTACRAAQTALQGQVTSLQTRQRTLAQQLQTEGKPIQDAVNALNGKQPDAALQGRIRAFQQREQQANQELQTGQQRIQSIQANVLRQLNERLGPIINQAMTARGANLAVDVDQTLAHGTGTDITNDVLARLNSAVPSVSVTPLPQQQQQAQPSR